MANRHIEKIEIDSNQLLASMKDAGYSIRGMAREIGNVSERTIRMYLDESRMPEWLLKKINRILLFRRKSGKDASKKLWMRIGVSVPVSDDELYLWMKRSKGDHEEIYWDDGYMDVDLDEKEAEEFLKRAVWDGDSYIPANVFEDYDDWFRKEEQRRAKK